MTPSTWNRGDEEEKKKEEEEEERQRSLRERIWRRPRDKGRDEVWRVRYFVR